MTDDRELLARQNLGLVHACCLRFSGKGVDYEELYAAGCLGLSKAIDRFDESLGYRFSTYAFPVIMGEIKRLFRDGGSVRVSRSLRELSLKIKRLNTENELKHGTELTVSQLAQRLNTDTDTIAQAIASAQTAVSLTVSDEDGEHELALPSPDIQYEVSERLSLYSALDTLDEKDRRLIDLRYFKNLTQTKTAKILSMTQVQVSRREKKILTLLRQKIG